VLTEYDMKTRRWKAAQRQNNWTAQTTVEESCEQCVQVWRCMRDRGQGFGSGKQCSQENLRPGHEAV